MKSLCLDGEGENLWKEKAHGRDVGRQRWSVPLKREGGKPAIEDNRGIGVPEGRASIPAKGKPQA